MKRKIKSTVNFCVALRYDNQIQRAKKAVLAFFEKIVLLNDFCSLNDRLYELVIFMQRKFTNRFIYKMAKLEMMESYWDIRLQDMKEKALERNNLAMIRICKSIEEDIKPEIKSYVLLKFLEQVQKLSWIFFYNNRKVERPEFCDAVEIDL